MTSYRKYALVSFSNTVERMVTSPLHNWVRSSDQHHVTGPLVQDFHRDDLLDGPEGACIFEVSRASWVRLGMDLLDKLEKHPVDDVYLHYHPHHHSIMTSLLIETQLKSRFPEMNVILTSPTDLSGALSETPLDHEYLTWIRLGSRLKNDFGKLVESPNLMLETLIAIDVMDKGIHKGADTGPVWPLYALANSKIGADPYGIIEVLWEVYKLGMGKAPGCIPWNLVGDPKMLQWAGYPTSTIEDIEALEKWSLTGQPCSAEDTDNWHMDIVTKLVSMGIPGGMVTADRGRRTALLIRGLDGAGNVLGMGRFLVGVVRKYCPVLLSQHADVYEKTEAWLSVRRKFLNDVDKIYSKKESTEVCHRCGRTMTENESEFGNYLRCVCGGTREKREAPAGQCAACGKSLFLQKDPRSNRVFVRCESYPSCGGVTASELPASSEDDLG